MRVERALGLFIVLMTARLVTIGGASIPFSVWTLPAYLWQDALTALTFALLDKALRGQANGKVIWALYAVAVFYVSLNAGIARVLYSPLTWTMVRAAGGPLTDSIWRSVTLGNISAVVLPALAGIVSPALLKRLCIERRAPLLICAAVLLAVTGPLAPDAIDTAGRHRNAFGALWPLATPAARAATGDGAWRTPMDEMADAKAPESDLTAYRGRAKGRNVVLVILESTAAQYLGAYGAGPDPTPHLTGAMNDGVVFENAFAVYPESIKGLHSVLCSRYPAFNSDARAYADLPCVSLAAQLRAAGYRTALFHSGRFMYLGMDAVVKNRGFDVLEDAGAIGGEVESSFGVDEPSTVRRLLQFIDSGPADAPFFAVYLPTAGHHPYATPDPGPFPDDGGIGSYRNALHYGDKSLGALFDGIKQRGLDRDTLFVLFGDHGEAFGQHAGNFAHTMFVYNENVRVPYSISAPGLIGRGRVQRAASLIDTAPTILDLLGLPLPQEYEGSSLLDPSPHMALFFTDYSLGWLGLVDGRWKAVHETGSNRTKLFDLETDPGETNDLSSSQPRRTRFYRERLEQWISAESHRRSARSESTDRLPAP